MKRLIALLLACVLLAGCGVSSTRKLDVSIIDEYKETPPSFTGLEDKNLLTYMKDRIYFDLIQELDNESYFVENIETVYISKEYLEELEYNSKSNIYFGYTLSELDEAFEGTRYIFTLDDNNQTIVTAFQRYDDTYEQVLKNVAIGAGVILISVTISAIASSVGAPAAAVSMMFVASAKKGAITALTGGAFGAISAGIVTGIKTGNFEEALKSAALSGSEGFKWGAITGTISGGASQFSALKGATLKGLTMNEAALIQKESKLPLEFIKNFHSMEAYQKFKAANLTLTKVNGKFALTQSIDWDFIGDAKDGKTNAERVLNGLSPLGPDGKAYELHHIGQATDSPLAILTYTDHKKNYKIYHANTGSTLGDVNHGANWAKQRQEFWKALLDETQNRG